MTRRHRRKTPAEIAIEAKTIAAGGPVPESRTPDRDTAQYRRRMEAWLRECPTCGAPPRHSCLSARPGSLRWAFHKARWQKLLSSID